MRLSCGADSMTVTLSTEKPFTGRLLGGAGGEGCGVLGTARRDTQLILRWSLISAVTRVQVRSCANIQTLPSVLIWSEKRQF